MGLDQTWLIDNKDRTGEHDKFTKIATHRKFNALEGFMAKKWFENGNSDEFNCQLLPITEKLLDELESTVEDNDFDPVEGFFFGNTNKNEYYDADIAELLTEVIPMVRQHMKDGDIVYYSSWW